ncbi:MAG: hypothetical protein ACLSFT_04125 [Ruminococcus callidus]
MRKEQVFALAAAGVLLTGCAKIEQEDPAVAGGNRLAACNRSRTVPQQYLSVAGHGAETQDVSMKLEAEDVHS